MHGAEPAGSSATLDRPLELLERALAFTRPVLVRVAGHDAGEPTPCAPWDLGDLLSHMVDGFTAFLQGAAGLVSPYDAPALPRDPALLAGHLRDLGCGVLGDWATTSRRETLLGLVPLPTDRLLEVAALEIAVHGWDLSRVCASDHVLPPELAAGLLPLAVRRVGPLDRPGRFGPVLEPVRRDPASLLLAQLGRLSP
ncbi:MAG: maleylpyruvate isomerase family mycothiol-dependent enzyme [Nocardioidaceae bacterium]